MACLTSLLPLLLLLLPWAAPASANSPPRISGKVHPRHVAKVGRNTKLPCPVDSNTNVLMMQWRKDGQSIGQGWYRFKTSQTGDLRIRNVTEDDAGHYSCQATNGAGSVYINYTLVVVNEATGIVKDKDSTYVHSPDEDLTKEGVAPRFADQQIMKRQHIVQPVGSSVRLKCRAVGNPIPHVLWFKDGSLIKTSTEHKRPRWILKLHRLQESDSGQYKCVVSNRIGAINHTYSLEVIEKFKTKPLLIPPHPRNTTVDVGGTVSFQCRVKSVVQPHIQWLKRVEGDVMPNLNTTIEVKGQKFMVLKTGEAMNRPDGSYLNKLVISRASEYDAGMYICLAANTMGYSLRSAFLTVTTGGASVLGPGGGLQLPAHNSSNSSTTPNNLALFIAMPACVVLILVLVAVFFLQRRKRCNSPSSPLAKIQRLPVPTQDKDYYGSSYHSGNTTLQTSRDRIPKTQSIDFCSDISSVSRTHHHHSHQHMQNYGY